MPVTDALEESEPDDFRWLDAASEVLEAAGEPAGCELRDVLTTIDQDYVLVPAEQARLRAAMAAIPGRADLIDLDLAGAEPSDHVPSNLIACKACREVLESRSP